MNHCGIHYVSKYRWRTGTVICVVLFQETFKFHGFFFDLGDNCKLEPLLESVDRGARQHFSLQLVLNNRAPESRFCNSIGVSVPHGVDGFLEMPRVA